MATPSVTASIAPETPSSGASGLASLLRSTPAAPSGAGASFTETLNKTVQGKSTPAPAEAKPEDAAPAKSAPAKKADASSTTSRKGRGKSTDDTADDATAADDTPENGSTSAPAPQAEAPATATDALELEQPAADAKTPAKPARNATPANSAAATPDPRAAQASTVAVDPMRQLANEVDQTKDTSSHPTSAAPVNVTDASTDSSAGGAEEMGSTGTPAPATTAAKPTRPGRPGALVAKGQESQTTAKSAGAKSAAKKVATAAPPPDESFNSTTAVSGGRILTDSADSDRAQTSSAAKLSLALNVSAPAATNTNPVASSSIAAPRAPAAPAPTPDAFAASNFTHIAGEVKTQLLPNGGTMQIRLDPPELGALSVHIEVKDGVVNASFQTSNDQATRLLSHSLGQLKDVLQSQGVTVDKLQVQQTQRNEPAAPRQGQQDASQQQPDPRQQQEQQRRQLMQRLWKRLSLGGDPLDLVA